MNRVVHFEIQADQPERAVEFYSSVFGWQVNKWPGPVNYWLIETGEGDGINGAIKDRVGPTSDEAIMGYVCTIEVASYDETAEKIPEAGGEVITEKMQIPGIGWHGYFKDTEGNVFGVMAKS
ncbi:MAG: VOC family protein [Planctomycetes bacterium]|nr:VOC family protein [Planctomycetota bacterium]